MLNDIVKYIEIEALGEKHNVYTRKAGNNPKIKVLLLHGGPGATILCAKFLKIIFHKRISSIITMIN